MRVDHIFREELQGDNSFMEKESGLSLFFGNKYSNKEMRETWNSGIKYGIEIGLRRASLEGQRLELDANTSNMRHKEFLKKFYELSAQYNCAIQYHPQIGMTVIDVKINPYEQK